MNPKDLFPRFAYALLALLFLSGVLLPIRYNMPYPASLAPRFDARIKNEHRAGIERDRPGMVLLGDSVLEEGVDAALLSADLGLGAYKVVIPGSGTAAWYLFMKNVLFEADHRPNQLIVLFRITMLTIPQYRTGGKYFYLLDDYAGEVEPVTAQAAFIDLMNPLEKFAAQYIPAYSARVEIREDLDNALRYPLPALAGCDRLCTDEAVGSIFGREVDPIALSLAQEDAAKLLYAPEETDFDRQLGTSLLPHMIELAQKQGVRLVFVRTKVYGPQTAALRQYTQDLDAYLAAQDGVILLDFENDPRILDSFYADSLHMNPYGKREFTKLLAAEFEELLLK